MTSKSLSILFKLYGNGDRTLSVHNCDVYDKPMQRLRKITSSIEKAIAFTTNEIGLFINEYSSIEKLNSFVTN
ncbi:hypothetical protein [Nostoc sp. 106C]|uniref:hypothetical protein n=1 Tax=Nostoc sp. 106C TaxID=1932667 RepID=UPI0011801923|nr:hypothetical protein [Nostoc sp. 106C]